MSDSFSGLAGRFLQLGSKLVAHLVDGCDNRTSWQTKANERRLRELQAGLNGFGHGVRHPDRVKPARMTGIART